MKLLFKILIAICLSAVMLCSCLQPMKRPAMTDGVTTTVPSQTKEASEPVPENDSSDTEMHCGGDYESEIELPEGEY